MIKAIAFAVLLGCTSNAHAGALDSLHGLQGTYTGSWEFFALDAGGNAVKTYAATDTATTDKPQRTGDRMFVAVHDVMQLPGHAMNVDFNEGYLVKPDGSAGDRFFEIYGQTIIERPIGDRAWAYQTPAAPQELDQLGFRGMTVLSAVHTTVKTESVQGHTETQHVTRLTTVRYKTPDGAFKSVQFVSMSGTHTREI
jgi:hypothetical protein